MTRVHILMYHRVGQFPGRVKAHGALYCHLPRFKAQMTMFRLLGYTVISLDDAAAGLRGDKPLPARPLVLTFDDAYVDFLDNAAPVLKAHGYPATVYAVSSLIGSTSMWDAGVGPEPAPLMTAPSAPALSAASNTSCIAGISGWRYGWCSLSASAVDEMLWSARSPPTSWPLSCSGK